MSHTNFTMNLRGASLFSASCVTTLLLFCKSSLSYMSFVFYAVRQKETIKRFCRELDIASTGSKMDMILRIRQLSMSATQYNAVYEKIFGISGIHV